MKAKITIALFSFFALTGIAAAQNPGKDIYVSKCSICHGPDGSGKTAIGKSLKIADFHSPDVQKLPDADLKVVITNGKNKMPPFKGKLTDSQLDQVIAYIRTFAK